MKRSLWRVDHRELWGWIVLRFHPSGARHVHSEFATEAEAQATANRFNGKRGTSVG